MKNTTLGYIEYNNKYLMLLRDIDKNDGSLGKWLGIGGKLEKYENADDCFIREVFEETGIKLSRSNISRRGIVDFKSENWGAERMFLFTACVDSDYFDPNCNEGTLKWINKTDVPSLNMWEGDFVFLDKIIADEKFFVCSVIYGGESGDELVGRAENKLILTDIDSLCGDNLNVYTGLNENSIKHIYEPMEGLFIAETPVVIKRAIDNKYMPESFLCEHKLLFDLAEYDYLDVPTYSASKELLCEITGYGLTHGMLSAMKRKPLVDVGCLISDSNIKKIAVLEDVMNPTNVGAIVRSAAALGVDALILTKGAADPLYRRAIRVSMGNIFDMPYSFVYDNEWISILKDNGYKIISMALSDNTCNITDKNITALKSEKIAICFGTESTGISDELIKQSDYIVKIPMYKNVDSLNVAASSAVAFFALCSE